MFAATQFTEKPRLSECALSFEMARPRISIPLLFVPVADERYFSLPMSSNTQGKIILFRNL